MPIRGGGRGNNAVWVPGPRHPAIQILNPNEEQLVAETEGRMLEERGIGMRTQPGLDAAIYLPVQMSTGRSVPEQHRSSRFECIGSWDSNLRKGGCPGGWGTANASAHSASRYTYRTTRQTNTETSDRRTDAYRASASAFGMFYGVPKSKNA